MLYLDNFLIPQITMIDIYIYHLFLILLILMESCLPNAFAHGKLCYTEIILGWASMFTAHTFIKEGKETVWNSNFPMH